jgi:hypothetical protein
LPVVIPSTWSGTADDLAAEVARVARELGLLTKLPSVRTIRLWRTKRLQIFEALAAAVLFERGWSTTAIVDRFATCDESELERTIVEATKGPENS